MSQQARNGGGNRKRTRAGFGSVRKLPSGRYQARYTGPDGAAYRAPVTFLTKTDAGQFLALRQAEILRAEWMPTTQQHEVDPLVLTFEDFASNWLEHRHLKPRTQADYSRILQRHLLPTFGELPVSAITREMVRKWYATLDITTPTMRAHAYALLRTILNSAVADEVIVLNPAYIRAAGSVERAKEPRPASLQELTAIVEAMPQRYRLMVLLAAWCALRFGELTELRVNDIDVRHHVIHVRRGVVRAGGEVVVGTPKSRAGTRDVAIPPHLIPLVEAHIKSLDISGQDALLFPAADGVGHLAPSTLYGVFYPARTRAGREDLSFHGLRHTGAVLAALTGATLAELMGRLGHSTPGAALRYQHAAAGRDRQIAGALSEMAARQDPLA